MRAPADEAEYLQVIPNEDDYSTASTFGLYGQDRIADDIRSGAVQVCYAGSAGGPLALGLEALSESMTPVAIPPICAVYDVTGAS